MRPFYVMNITLATTVAASSSALPTIWRRGSSGERSTMWAPILSSPSSLAISSYTAGIARTRATPPPGTMPSSTAVVVEAEPVVTDAATELGGLNVL